MQDRYVGDIGDYVKLALLRNLMPGRRLGVAWWLYPDEDHQKDGRHADYLRRPQQWRKFDPDLFDVLDGIVLSGKRHTGALEQSALLPGALFCREPVPTQGKARQRKEERVGWFERVRDALRPCDLVFLDPDNGLEPAHFSTGKLDAGKSVSLAELAGLAAEGRTLMVYHQQTRKKGGHFAEIAFWTDRLRGAGFSRVDAIRSRPYAPRVFFLLDAPEELRARAEALTGRWEEYLSWHPDPGETREREYVGKAREALLF